jgi:predicted small lipoprotein YifL
MKHVVELFLLAVVISLVGCGAPKPPGWPAGEERPINAAQNVKALR